MREKDEKNDKVKKEKIEKCKAVTVVFLSGPYFFDLMCCKNFCLT